MKILTELREEGRAADMQAVIDAIPYARFLGVKIDQKGNEITTILPFRNHLVGNVIALYMEATAQSTPG